MYVYEISSYTDIASIAPHFLIKKQIAVEFFSKTFDIYKPILLQKNTGGSADFNCPNMSKLAKLVLFISIFKQN